MTITIRRADRPDLDAFRFVGFSTCPATYGPFAGPGFVVRQLDQWWNPERLVPALERGDCLVAVDDDVAVDVALDVGGAVVGVAEVGRYSGELVMWKLYILPSHQGQGIGRSLLTDVRRLAVQRNLPLATEYIAGNTLAGAFYRSQGFIERSVPGSLLESVWLRDGRDAQETPAKG